MDCARRIRQQSIARPTVMQCALLILDDACPPDRTMYLCEHGEDPEISCVECWRRYLFYVDGGMGPYRADDASLE